MIKAGRIQCGILILLSIYSISSCKKESNNLPIISTTGVTDVSYTSALTGGNITNDGGLTVTERGVCWSTNTTPTILDNKTIDGAGAGTFVSLIDGLSTGTTYFVRAYATNSSGTGYGMVMSFTTSKVLDIDGNSYHAVKVGTQLWMAENLKTSKYRNGDRIETTIPATLNVLDANNPKFQWPYSGMDNNIPLYGRLYTWYALSDIRNVCPTGWHVPSYNEWVTLINYLGGANNAGGKLKEVGNLHWSSNAGATNESGFTALPGGIRHPNGTFSGISEMGFWWSTTQGIYSLTEAWAFYLHNDGSVISVSSNGKNAGFSIRCIKD